jgi:hypothetical protein
LRPWLVTNLYRDTKVSARRKMVNHFVANLDDFRRDVGIN